MATSDRLYELSCECRDNEEALERIRREAAHQDAVIRAAYELVEVLTEHRPSGGSFHKDIEHALACLNLLNS